MKPLIKWAGGKQRQAAFLASLIPEDTERYYEPFCGGAALFFHLCPERRPKWAMLSDVNVDLMNFYQQVARNSKEVTTCLHNLARGHVGDKDYFKKVRVEWNSPECSYDLVQRAAVFFYLNKACFNGLWRVNSKGQFNTPQGDLEKLGIPDLVPYQLMLFMDIELKACNFMWALKQIFAQVSTKSFVYLDPPYYTERDSFTGYTHVGFGQAEHLALARNFKQLAAAGVYVVLSNADLPAVREMYAGFEILQLEAGRFVGGHKERRAKASEIIVTWRR